MPTKTKTEAIRLRETLVKKARALEKLKPREPRANVIFKKSRASRGDEKNPLVLSPEILFEKGEQRRRKCIQRDIAAHPSFREIARASSVEYASQVLEEMTYQTEEALVASLVSQLDPFHLVSVSPASGSPGTQIIIDARVTQSALEDCMILYTREEDGVSESSRISGATKQGRNRYSIDSVVPDMPGAPIDQNLTIQMIEYEQYVVEIPDINTPPVCFYLTVRASNKLDFAWNPGIPVIEIFELNWDVGETTVSPGQTIRLKWKVKHVRRIQVRRISPTGPALNAIYDFPDMRDTVLDSTPIGPFNGFQPATARYQITAENEFGSVSRVGEVRLRQDPDITILGVEVTQAIQRFTLDDTVEVAPGVIISASPWNNSVDLVHQKRTMARVYVDSGLINNFDNGAGPNTQPNITGEIKVYQGDIPEPSFTISPRNPTGAITARPSGDIDRDDMEHTLNFEIPWDLLPSPVQLEVTVWVESDVDGNNHQNDSRYSSRYKDFHDSTVFDLHLQGEVAMVPALFIDSNLGNAAPSLIPDYFDTVEGAETRYPVGINGFSTTSHVMFMTTRDLTTTAGWRELL